MVLRPTPLTTGFRARSKVAANLAEVHVVQFLKEPRSRGRGRPRQRLGTQPGHLLLRASIGPGLRRQSDASERLAETTMGRCSSAEATLDVEA